MERREVDCRKRTLEERRRRPADIRGVRSRPPRGRAWVAGLREHGGFPQAALGRGGGHPEARDVLGALLSGSTPYHHQPPERPVAEGIVGPHGRAAHRVLVAAAARERPQQGVPAGLEDPVARGARRRRGGKTPGPQLVCRSRRAYAAARRSRRDDRGEGPRARSGPVAASRTLFPPPAPARRVEISVEWRPWMPATGRKARS